MTNWGETPLLGARILVVDDEDDARELFALALEAAGAEVRTARGAAEALHAVHDWTPSVIASDLSMPEIDGFGLLRELRLLDGFVQIPVIAVSSLPYARTRAAVLAAGFQDHAGKPISPDAFVALVARWAFKRPSKVSTPT